MLKTVLNMLEEVLNPYLLNNPLKTLAENKNGSKIATFSTKCLNFRQKKIEIQKSDSTMSCAISQLVYMPNFRAIGQSVWEKNGNRQKHRKTETQKDRKTDTLEFYKDRWYSICLWKFDFFISLYTSWAIIYLYKIQVCLSLFLSFSLSVCSRFSPRRIVRLPWNLACRLIGIWRRT